MPTGVAVIDANLLVPIVACDFLLTAFDHGAFDRSSRKRCSMRSSVPEERQRFRSLQDERSQDVLDAPLQELYDVREVDVEAPKPARVLVSVCCTACGEPTMETRIVRLDGRDLCRPCYDRSLDGEQPIAVSMKKPAR